MTTRSAASTSEACKRKHYARPGHVSLDERSLKITTLAVESYGRLGVEGRNFIDQLGARVVGRGGWGVDGKERGGKGTPAPNHLGGHTGHYFEEGVTLQARKQEGAVGG